MHMKLTAKTAICARIASISFLVCSVSCLCFSSRAAFRAAISSIA